jgi:hypothetical protein
VFYSLQAQGAGKARDADLLAGQEASAFTSSGDTHDNRYYTEEELKTSDGNPPNEGTNRVRWDNLIWYPSGVLRIGWMM